MNQLIVLVLAQLVLGLANAQYGSMPQQLPQQQQQIFRDQPMVDSYGSHQSLPISLDQSLPENPCLQNPCRNFGTCQATDDHEAFWCLCLFGTSGDLCEEVLTTTPVPTTTTTTTRVPVRRPLKVMPAPIRTQSSYQTIQRDSVVVPPTPAPQYSQPQYGQQQQRFLDVVPTTVAPTTVAPYQPPQPQYGQQQQQRFLDVVPAVVPTTVAPYQPPQQQYAQPQRFLDVLPTTTPVVSYRPQPQPQIRVQPSLPVVPSYGQQQQLPQLDLTPQFVQQLSGCMSNPCMNEGSCVELSSGNFRCDCPWGWVGRQCETCITECASNPCGPNKRCRARYGGGYDCICPPNRTGFNCEILNDVCSSRVCANGGTCKPTGSDTSTCICRDGFAGDNCERRWNNPCTAEVLRSVELQAFEYPWDSSYYIICTDIDVWSKMPCANSTFFDKATRECVPNGFERPQCPQGYCLNDGDCYVDATNHYACKCKAGYAGQNCEIDIDECQLNRNACAGGMCIDQINTYYCVCAGSRVGLDCANTISAPCQSDNIDPELAYFTIPSPNNDHFLHCTSLGLWQVRKCADGLFWNPEERTCTMDRPKPKTGVCTTLPCKNGGECVDLGGSSFRCECKSGYTGQFCEVTIDYCLSNPCQNGGRCLSYQGGYTCVCQDKIIDECCCTGVINPCPEKSKLVPGVNNYFPHLFPHRYIHCDFDGRAFVRTCAPGTRWVQSVFSCLSEDFVLNVTTSAPQILRDFPSAPSYGQQPQQQFIPPAPLVQQPSYGQQQLVVPEQPRQPLRDLVPAYQQPTTTQAPVPRPVFRDFQPSPSYGQQSVPLPTTTQAALLRDAPVPQSSYGQQLPLVQQQPSSSYGQQQPADLQRLSIGRVAAPVQGQSQQNFARVVSPVQQQEQVDDMSQFQQFQPLQQQQFQQPQQQQMRVVQSQQRLAAPVQQVQRVGGQQRFN